MLLPRGPLAHPVAQDGNLGRIQGSSFIWRRHPLVGVSRCDAPDQLALFWLPGEDDWPAFAIGQCSFRSIEPEMALPLAFIGAVALEAAIREDRPYVAVEFDAGFGTTGDCRQKQKWR